jgi:regulatory protein
MKITKITQQVKRANRYSVYVDETYSFSLSETALLDSGISSGRELTDSELLAFKQLSQDDKIYGQALRYIAMRSHTTWEVQSYMERKGSPPGLIEETVFKLTDLGLLDDLKYAKSFASDRRLLRSSSKRKITADLRAKRVSDSIIREAIGSDPDEERQALAAMIVRKRRQSKYQDDQKLMQYLARQGYGYDDIKRALRSPDDY